MRTTLYIFMFSLFCGAACSTKQCECETFHDEAVKETNTYTKFSTCSEYESEHAYPEYTYKVICREL